MIFILISRGDGLAQASARSRENINVVFTRKIIYKRGSVRKVAIPYPDPASGCQRIMRSGISLTRETYGRHREIDYSLQGER
jgi:hypothetical protein